MYMYCKGCANAADPGGGGERYMQLCWDGGRVFVEVCWGDDDEELVCSRYVVFVCIGTHLFGMIWKRVYDVQLLCSRRRC